MTRVTSTSPTSPTASGGTAATEPAKVKRKGARSVSTLTPSQLARKRANDREAQRAIRARTKEHIERLERELEELKSQQNRTRDETVQDLLRRNKILEEELVQLRRSSPMSQYYAPEALSVTSTPATMPSPPRVLTSSSGSGPQAFCGQPTTPNSATGPDYGVLTSNGTSEYGTPGSTSSPTYSVVPDAACDSWTTALIQHPTIPSNVSSPGSATPASAAGPDEFGRGGTFIATAAGPAGIDGMQCISTPGPNDALESFNDMDSGDVYPPAPSPTSHHHTVIAHPQPHHANQPPYLHQPHSQGIHPSVAFGGHHAQANHHAPWTMYPAMYYQNRSPVPQM